MKKLMIGALLLTCILTACQKDERHRVLLVGGQIIEDMYDLVYESYTQEDDFIRQTFQLSIKHSESIDQFYGASITFDRGNQRITLYPTEIWINGTKCTETSGIIYGHNQVTIVIVYDVSDYDITFELISDVSFGNQITVSTQIPWTV
jgi:hypothetical protein